MQHLQGGHTTGQWPVERRSIYSNFKLCVTGGMSLSGNIWKFNLRVECNQGGVQQQVRV